MLDHRETPCRLGVTLKFADWSLQAFFFEEMSSRWHCHNEEDRDDEQSETDLK